MAAPPRAEGRDIFKPDCFSLSALARPRGKLAPIDRTPTDRTCCWDRVGLLRVGGLLCTEVGFEHL